MDTLVIQTGTRHGRFAELIRAEGNELTIGRGFDNDLVLTDLHVAPQQARFYREGDSWKLQVLDHTNPVLLNGKPVVDDIPPVHSGDLLTIGRTRLSLFADDHPVESTRKLVLSNLLTRETIHPALPITFLVLVCLFDLGLAWFEGATDLKWQNLAAAELLGAVIVVSWAGLWAIAGRMTRHQHHFGLQTLATLAVFLIAGIAGYLVEYAAYPFHSPMVVEVFGWIVFFITLALLLYLNLVIAVNPRRAKLASSLLAALVTVVSYGFFYFGDSEEFQYDPTYSTELKPPLLGLYKGVSADDYFDSIPAMVESLAEQLNEEK